MSDYLDRLKEAIQATHGLKATHIGTVALKETFQGQTVWEGDVEVFGVDHPKTQECYAWGYEENDEFKAIAVLGIPPVNTAQNAVQAYIVSQNNAK